ncbi:ABC transporter ATP-binding protein [Faunimonas pinastri]|uniref:ABC transporter ATP-binding protein n=1 Tax=Faunimonas pinastri TaxID=1855383 RepID=UPI0015A716A5|nr:ABC transporter ATP-binding protein [Faunimonas pinastri]
MDSRDVAVALRGLTKSFDGRAVLAGLSLRVERGEFLAIVGPSGSGKTTLLRIVAGFERPDEGSVEIGGRDVTLDPPERRRVNTVFQSYALFPHMNVLENVAYGPRMQGLSRRGRHARARDMLALVRLEGVAGQRPHELSGGMQQRVALARALANEPEVLLLDEPLGALDRKLRDEMQRELRRVQAELGATFLYITHDQEEAFGMADRLAVMRDGRFVQVGTPSEVYDDPADAWVALFVGSGNAIPGRVETIGPHPVIATDFGPLHAGGGADLARGSDALVVVRPEATRFSAWDESEGGPNRIPADLVDIVTLGSSMRLRARTAGGLDLESVRPRTEPGSPGQLAPGSRIAVSFAAEAARVYRPDPGLRTG